MPAMTRNIALACAALMAATSSRAGDITVRAPGGVTPEAERLLADIAEPLRVPVPAGRTAADVALQLCGRATPNYLRLLEAANPGRTVLDAVDITTIYLFPACFVFQPETALNPQQSAIAREIAGKEVVMSGNKTFGKIREAAAQLFAPIMGQRLVRTVVSDATVPAAYQLKPGKSAADIDRLTSAAPLAISAQSADLTLESDVDQRLSKPVDCPPALPQIAAWPFDAAALYRALVANDAFRKHLDLDAVEPAILVVADNGVDGIGTFFPTALFANVGEIVGDHDDDDGSGYADDPQGVNLYSGEPPRPLGNIAPWHGTHLAGLGVGGPAFQEIREDQQPRPRVRLLAVGLVNAVTRPDTANGGNVTSFTLPSNGPFLALTYAVKRKADVLNLSVSTPETLQPFVGTLASNNVLVVAAAGNRATNYSRVLRYPAAYGGQPQAAFSLPIVTVAAHDKVGCLATFSGRGHNTVDLAAPGVDIRSFDLGGGERVVEGTSQATALVSFAAALLTAEGFQGQAIKKRLIASVDPRPSLQAYVLAEGSLNIVKAVRRYEDLVETAQGLEGGKLAERFQLAEVCPAEVNDGTTVLKIVGTGGAQIRALLQRPNGNFEYVTCVPSKPSFSFTGPNGARDVTYAEVIDVVPQP